MKAVPALQKLHVEERYSSSRSREANPGAVWYITARKLKGHASLNVQQSAPWSHSPFGEHKLAFGDRDRLPRATGQPTQVGMNRRGDDQRQNHRNENPPDHSDGEGLEHLGPRTDRKSQR